MPVMKVIKKGMPVKVWTDQIDDNAILQLENMSMLPFIHKHIAVMPDVHWGMGATIGSVIPSKGAIVPAAVGVDLGCGMMAVQTSLTANELPDEPGDANVRLTVLLSHMCTADIEAAERFHETVTDDGTYDINAIMRSRLSLLGLIINKGRGIYYETDLMMTLIEHIER